MDFDSTLVQRPAGARGFVSLSRRRHLHGADTFSRCRPESPVQYITGVAARDAADDARPIPGRAAVLRQEHVQRVLLAGQLQPRPPAEPDRQRRRPAGAAEAVRQPAATAFLDTNNWAPRLGAVYDPFNDGRSKVSVSYGRYYEAIPLDVAARYFAGENFVNLVRHPSRARATCRNPYNWTGAGEYKKCDPASDADRRPFNSAVRPVQHAGASTTTRSSRPPNARSSRT